MVSITGFDAGIASSLSIQGSAATVDTSLPLFVAFDTSAGDLLVSNVPEPTSLALIGVGGLMLLKRRHRAA